MAGQLCKELLVKVGYGDVSCKLWGSNLPSAQKFLAIHGWLDNAGSFDPLMKHFLRTDNSRERVVACVDMPGHGFSSHLPKGIPYSPASDLQGIRSVVKHLGWTRFNLIGHSMGAMRTQFYALCFPNEIESIINFDGAMLPLGFGSTDDNPYTSWGRQIDKFMKYTNEYHGTPREHTWEELAERWMAATPGITEDDFAILMKRGAKQLESGKYVYTRDTALHNRTNAVLQHTLEMNIKCMKVNKNTPLLYIRAIESTWDQMADEATKEKWEKSTRLVQSSYPNAFEIAEFDGTHHFHMQKPDEISDLMNDFLRRHEKTISEAASDSSKL